MQTSHILVHTSASCSHTPSAMPGNECALSFSLPGRSPPPPIWHVKPDICWNMDSFRPRAHVHYLFTHLRGADVLCVIAEMIYGYFQAQCKMTVTFQPAPESVWLHRFWRQLPTRRHLRAWRSHTSDWGFWPWPLTATVRIFTLLLHKMIKYFFAVSLWMRYFNIKEDVTKTQQVYYVQKIRLAIDKKCRFRAHFLPKKEQLMTIWNRNSLASQSNEINEHFKHNFLSFIIINTYLWTISWFFF